MQDKMLNLILFGPPGSGKGTQATRLAEKYNLLHLSTGDLLRAELKKESPLGKEARKFMDQGMLVPDEVVIGMISEKIDETAAEVNGYLFDGFPRTNAQAEALDKLLELKETSIRGVLALEVGEEEITQRILKRAETSGRSDDADEATIRNRFQVYLKSTAPVAKYYDQHKKLKSLKGEGSIDDIFDSLCTTIDTIS